MPLADRACPRCWASASAVCASSRPTWVHRLVLKTYVESETVCRGLGGDEASTAQCAGSRIATNRSSATRTAATTNAKVDWHMPTPRGRVLGHRMRRRRRFRRLLPVALARRHRRRPWRWATSRAATTFARSADDAINVVSNKPAGQPFRGVARPLSCIGHEVVMDGLGRNGHWHRSGRSPACATSCSPKQMPYVVNHQEDPRQRRLCGAALKRAAELIDLAGRSRASEEGRARWPADR